MNLRRLTVTCKHALFLGPLRPIWCFDGLCSAQTHSLSHWPWGGSHVFRPFKESSSILSCVICPFPPPAPYICNIRIAQELNLTCQASSFFCLETAQKVLVWGEPSVRNREERNPAYLGTLRRGADARPASAPVADWSLCAFFPAGITACT